MYPKARAVTAQATSEDDPAAARLSLLQALMWVPPANFDTRPTTAANMANVKNRPVAPFPPKPGILVGQTKHLIATIMYADKEKQDACVLVHGWILKRSRRSNFEVNIF